MLISVMIPEGPFWLLTNLPLHFYLHGLPCPQDDLWTANMSFEILLFYNVFTHMLFFLLGVSTPPQPLPPTLP